MEILELTTATEKAEVVEQILTALPAWFGLPEATAAYVQASRDLTCFAAQSEGEWLGFVTLAAPFTAVVEINAMGVVSAHHRQGIGEALMQQVFAWCQEKRRLFLQVKTLAPSHPDENYALTRLFYQSQGFTELEVFPTLWGEEAPCLQLIMAIPADV